MGLVGRARPWIAAWVLLVASCASVDPNVFNEALRTATFRAYLGAIEAQFGGLEAAGVTAGELRDRYRKRAMAAQSPESFYRVLSEMLADLDDPHAVMRVSPRFWDAPVAEPEWSQFVMSRGSVWVGLPRRSVRSPEDYAESLGVWLRPFGSKPLGEFEPLEIAALLRSSAAFSGRSGLASAREPLAWLRLRAIDGIEIESPHDAELVVRGPLCSTVEFQVDLEGVPATIALMRNAGVFEGDSLSRGIRRRYSPLELAATLESEEGVVVTGPSSVHGGRSPVSANRARREGFRRSAFPSGRRFRLNDPAAEAFGIEAWHLRTPEGRRVAYLRIERFEPRVYADGDVRQGQVPADPVAGPNGSVEPRLDAALQAAFAALNVDGWRGDDRRAVDGLIVDVTGNAGGSWVETGLLLSFFLDAETEVVPHSVVTVVDSGWWFFRARTRAKQFLARADVRQVEPKQLVVLVDQSTASAGEITAATLRGVAGATLIGERTAGAEYSTAEFRAPDGSVLRIGLSGGMEPPLPSFQGVGIEPDVVIQPFAEFDEALDLEAWRAGFRFLALEKGLERIDRLSAVEAEL